MQNTWLMFSIGLMFLKFQKQSNRRCGSVEMLDVTGIDESDIRSYECADCFVCDSCRHCEGYRCPDWPVCHYEI
jgi:hypothetical protein